MPNSNELTIPDEVVDGEHSELPTVLMPDLATDLHNAWALTMFGDGRVPGAHKLRWTPGLGWLWWDGQRWQRDEGEVHVYQTAKLTILFMTDTHHTHSPKHLLTGQPVDDAHAKWLHSSQNRSRLASMIELARTEPPFVVYVAELDAHPDELNVANGILDLKTLKLRDHDPAALHTKVTTAAYRPSAEAPFWIETVTKALKDEDVRRFVQKLLGSSLLGTYSEHLGVAHGPGSNLKSTVLSAVRDALGDYAMQATSDLLVEQPGGSARGDSALASLRGCRLVIASETAEGVPLHDALVKGLTGEHVIRSKFMRQDTFEFDNQAAVWLSTNHKPRTQGSDEAIWRRLVLVPFTYVVPDNERREQDEVQAILHSERDGILSWLVDGLRMFRDDNGKLEQPAAIRAATAAYRRESDPLADWLDDEVSFDDPNAVSPVAAVRSAYLFHCQAIGNKYPIAAPRFNADLERRGARQDRPRVDGKRTRVWVGLRLVNQTPI